MPGPRIPFLFAALLALLLPLASGCLSVPRRTAAATRRALHPPPRLPDNADRPDRALLAAFFEASGVPLTPSEIELIIPDSALPARMDRNAFRRIARDRRYLLLALPADESGLWQELGRNTPLLLLLPPAPPLSAPVLPVIPLAWDRSSDTIDLLDGSGTILSLPTADFFSRRAPLRHAALCLASPEEIRRRNPTREQKLLLADFWFHRGDLRRADAAYAAIPSDGAAPADVDALLGHGNVLIRQRRFKDAIPVFRSALALAPHNPRILNNLAYAMLSAKVDLPLALQLARQALALEPENPLFLETVGSLYLELDDPSSAARHLERAWARAHQRPPRVQVAILDQLIRAWLATDRPDLARQVLDHRRRSFPDIRMPRDLLAALPEPP